MTIKNYARQNTLLVTLKGKMPKDMKMAQWEDMKFRALSMIWLAIETDIKYNNVLEEENSKESWDKLTNNYI